MPQLDTVQYAESKLLVLKHLQCVGLRTMTKRTNDRLDGALSGRTKQLSNNEILEKTDSVGLAYFA